uniref:Regulatory protein E2 n=1 Tax=Human papillomavirus TaxID=10566 RepID=A0A3R5T6P3_9PAPI|nr:MAG: E2 protein [Human papillomavirus]
MNQRELTDRLDALQSALIELYEEAPTDLASQIRHQDLLRKQSVLEYYCRKEGYTQLGLHHLPVLRVSEYHAKQAIQMGILLRSLQKSAYGKESWTLQETSADLYNSPPRNCFKKGGFDVEVWFDKNPLNAFPYTNWSWIYYQDEKDEWQKVPGLTDYNGLYYEEKNGDRNYFLLFEKDASRYGNTNEWTVNFKNEQLSLPTNSAARRSAGDLPQLPSSVLDQQPSTSRHTEAPSSDKRGEEQTAKKGAGATPRKSGRRRRGGEGEQTSVKRRRRDGGGGGTHKEGGNRSAPTPDQVGSSHRSVDRTGLSRLDRLQKEARDPFLILIRGPPNKLKCWRYRCNSKCDPAFQYMSTVWRWVTDDAVGNEGRVLISFGSREDRDRFAKTTIFPKDTTYALGSLDAL